MHLQLMQKRIKTIDQMLLSSDKRVALIGTTAYHRNRWGAYFPVTIHDTKWSYGFDRFLLRPVNGAGQFWARGDSVTLDIA